MTDDQPIDVNINTYSKPSELKITDMRICNLRGLPMDCTVIRLDTNQGISGYGEVRDWASPSYALMLKNRILGENPCNIDRIFRKLKQFGYHARQGGGVSGIEMALFDLVGKAYGVPAYQLLGGKFRDKVLCYCDTDSMPEGQQMGERLKRRKERGFKFLKMDIGIGLLLDVPGALSGPPDMLHTTDVMHPFTGIQITPTGIDFLVEYVRQVRDVIGYQVPLAVDHFGHINLESCIRLGQALDQFTLAWYEDMIPWQFTDQYVRLSQAVNTPICTGEDIYLKEGFRPLLEKRGVSVIHPDLATSGGLMETKKIGDLAQEYGVAMAMHFAGSPISFLANIPYLVGRTYSENNARGQIIGDNGMLKLIFSPDDKKLLGVHHIGESASELVHIGSQIISAKGTIDVFIQSVYNYPTLSEMYKYAAYDGLGNLEKWILANQTQSQQA